jgi:SAM-dependent methyltransferase
MDYSSIFSDRASRYVVASSRAPDIRANEFRAYLNCLALEACERFLDTPCGSGQAYAWLPDGVSYLGLDPAADFVRACKAVGAPAVQSDMRRTPFQDGYFDVIGSLTGVHHEVDRRSLYAEWWRLLRPGGRLVLADVLAGSKVALFLNGFVAEWNSKGHDGDFLNAGDLADLSAVGFSRQEIQQLSYDWEALSETAMYEFMLDLFGLDRKPDMPKMREAWELLGWRSERGRCKVPWGLVSICAVKG